jgi:hypothetical protein
VNDRELLELAAKAAGIRLHVWGTKGAENFADMDAKTGGRWNPLADDGDAFRLAVLLGIHVFSPDYPEYHGSGDACAAVRRVIVEAAARLGAV